MKAIIIAKTELPKVDFHNKEVLDSKKKVRNRLNSLKSAALSKNKKGDKLKITFRSKRRGPLSVISPVLIADKKYVILRGGHYIPTKSILKVQ